MPENNRPNKRKSMPENNHPNKRQKRQPERRPVACDRCHEQKIKCSLQIPCAGCVAAKRPDECRYKSRDRNVTLPESYVETLEKENQELRAKLGSSAPSTVQDASKEPPSIPGQVVDIDVANPLLDISDGLFAGQDSSQPVFVGEASCTAFGDRLLKCVNRRYSTISCNTMPDHVTHPAFQRLLRRDVQMPAPGEARLLIRVAQSFIGQNYHLLERKSFFEKLDRAYRYPETQDLLFQCHLFAVLAIGELYSSCHSTATDHRVPGTNWYIQAVGLLQDLYEVASIEQVQILLLLSFYANTLGRIRSAHVYCGIALRLAIGLGLHRSQSGISTMDPVQRETRRRVWWTLYLFDRMVSSKLGYPLGIRDDDIDVELPSMDGLSTVEQTEFEDPAHLCAHVGLGRITGDILSDVYCMQQRNKTTFVRRVHRVLNDLRNWEEQLPAPLRLHPDSSARSLYTLHMQYHLCIIQTTRPILLHLFRSRFSPASKDLQSFSPTTHALAEACVQAARKTSQQLSKLRVEGNLAVYGYFDSHYLFSSTLVLIINAVMEPTVSISDLVQTSFSVLRGMANNGNISASDYLNRLELIRSVISKKSSSIDGENATMLAALGGQKPPFPDTPRKQQNANGHVTSAHQVFNMNPTGTIYAGDGFDWNDPLDNHFIDAFLDEEAFQRPFETSPEQNPFGQFMYELGDDFIFGDKPTWNVLDMNQQQHHQHQA